MSARLLKFMLSGRSAIGQSWVPVMVKQPVHT